MKKIKMIMAATQEGIVGKDNEIPWIIPQEMSHFRRTTDNSLVIMGFMTWMSLAALDIHALPNRYNIVISNREGEDNPFKNKYPDLLFANYNYCTRENLNDKCKKLQLDNIFVIGGPLTWKHFLDNGMIDEVIISKIHHRYKGNSKMSLDFLNKDFTLLSVDKRDQFDILYYQKNS